MPPSGPLLLLLMSGLSAVAAPAETTEAALARMDQEAAAFRDMTAKLKKASFTAVLNETSQESGTIWLRRAGAKRVLMRVEFTEPDPRSVGLDGTTGQVYYPKIQTVQIYNLGKSSVLIDQFSLLGFGTPRKELEKSYTIRAAGEETIDGRPATRLELTPKPAKVLEHVKKVELWIPLDAGHPVQQKFFQPGGDYYLITYSDLKLNPNLAEAAFKLALPKGVKREYPQQ